MAHSMDDANKNDLSNIAEIIDRLVSVPVFSGSSLAKKPVVLDLYAAARSKFGVPLVYHAFDNLAKGIGRSNSKSVLILTGFVVPPWLEPETDGPVGAASLARSINLAWDVTPVIVTEPAHVARMGELLKYAGLGLKKEYFNNKNEDYRKAAVEGFTLDLEEAKNRADSLIERVSPAALISIEKASPNSKGVYHSGVGVDLSPFSAKVDALVEAAKKADVPTI